MPAKIIRGYESWFVNTELNLYFDYSRDLKKQMLEADKRVSVIEYALCKMRVVRTKSQIDSFRKRLVDSHKPDKLVETLVECILTSTPEYWRANDLFYRAIIAEYNKLRQSY